MKLMKLSIAIVPKAAKIIVVRLMPLGNRISTVFVALT